MNALVRCKACGYVVEERKLSNVCPACGVPRKAFEPYKDPLSPARSRLLSLHLHPIAVHFPQAFASIIPVLLAAGWLLPVPFTNELVITALVLLYILPFTIVPAIITGLLDGKLRFKSVKPQLLVKKIILGTLFFVLSITEAAIVCATGLSDTVIPWIILIGILCIGCVVILGNLGSSVMESKLPG